MVVGDGNLGGGRVVAGRSRVEVGGRSPHHPLDPLYPSPCTCLYMLAASMQGTVIDCDRDHPGHQLEAATPKFVTDVKYAGGPRWRRLLAPDFITFGSDGEKKLTETLL